MLSRNRSLNIRGAVNQYLETAFQETQQLLL